jgi:hypothetical protein
VAIDTIPTFNFQLAKYEPDPKTVCCLCKECFETSHLITVPENKNICVKCAQLLGEIAEGKRSEIRLDGIKEIMETFRIDGELAPDNVAEAMWDAGYRKME